MICSLVTVLFIQLYCSGNDLYRCPVAGICHYVQPRSSHSDNRVSGGLYPENKIVLYPDVQYSLSQKGRIGRTVVFSLELKGRHHVAAAISYVLRNPSGHEVCVNPYDYPFSSIRLYFKSLIISPVQQKHSHGVNGKKGMHPRLISVTNSLPDWVDIDPDGQINPDQIVCSDLVEG